MAIQKNFVIHNGLEVNTDLIFANTNSNKVGIATTNARYTLDVFGGIGATDLYVSGVVTSTTYYGDGSNLTGIASLGGDAIYNNVIVGGGLSVVGISTFDGNVIVGGGLSVVGLSTFDNDVTIGGRLSVVGLSTFGNILLNPTGIITAVSGIVTYYGDGQYLQNILSGVGVATEGGTVGTGATILDFRGAGISTVTVSSGIATINIDGGGSGTVSIGTEAPTVPSNGDLWYSPEYGRTFVWYDEVALGIGSTAVWVDAAPFNVNLSQLDDLQVNSLVVLNHTDLNTLDVSGISTLSSLNVGDVNSSGIITAVDFNSTSDENLKYNIETVNNALGTIDSLRGVKFQWKEDDRVSYGVIAQELQEVLPELVSVGNIKTVNYNGIIGVLIEAVKELKKEVEDLKNTK